MEKECNCDPCNCDPCKCTAPSDRAHSASASTAPSDQIKKKCPCPPECRDKMKAMYRYLQDTKVFLSSCDKCPLAQNMLKQNEQLLKDFTCTHKDQLF